MIWGQTAVSEAAIVGGLSHFFLVEDLRVNNLVDRKALHFVKILAHSVIVVAREQVFQRHKWFASMGA